MTQAVTADLLLRGRYRLLRQLARGGMATVWEAEDVVLSRRVAVKILHPHLAADAAFRERFRREAVAVARLTHPSLVAVFDTGDDDGVAFLVMELVEGVTLRELLDERGPLPVGQAVEIAVQIAAGLAVAHERGVVHRDVKPGNVLVLPDGRAKLTDFGIARGGETSGGDDLTRTGTVVGTAKYLAPEQVQGGTLDGRTDVYALGLVLYEMLCGRAPFEGSTELTTALARLQNPPPPPRQLRADIPRGLEAVVVRAMALDPGDRFPSVAELRAALLSLDLRPAGDTPPAGLDLRPGEDRRFTLGVAAVIVVAVAVALVGALLAGTDAGRSVLEGVRSGLGGGGSPRPVAITGAHDFDPFGDGQEWPELAGAVYDGNPQTAWRTDTYRSPTFGNLKPGVGIWVQLDAEHRVRQVRVHTVEQGWSGEIYVGDGSARDLAGWGRSVARGSDLGTDATFDVGGARGSAVLLWITRLPASGRLDVGEVQVAA